MCVCVCVCVFFFYIKKNGHTGFIKEDPLNLRFLAVWFKKTGTSASFKSGDVSVNAVPPREDSRLPSKVTQ